MKPSWRALAAALMPLIVPQLQAGDSPAKVAFEQANDLTESYVTQLKWERALCSEELARGVADNRWSKELQERGEARLEIIFSAEPNASAHSSPPDSQDQLINLVQRAKMYENAADDTGLLFRWLSQRIGVLVSESLMARNVLDRTAAAYVEEVWINSRRVEELAPAVRALTLCRDRERPEIWNTYVRPEYSRLSEFPFSPIIFEWSIMAGPEPLVLPDPAKDPIAFAKARNSWLILREGRHPFVNRTKVAAKFDELDAIYLKEVSSAREPLQKAILGSASASELQPLVSRFSSLCLAPGKNASERPGAPSRPPSFRPSGPQLFVSPDYRTMLVSFAQRPDSHLVDLADEAKLYEQWYKLVEKEERNESTALPQLRAEVRKSIAGRSGPVWAYIAKHLKMSERPRPIATKAVIPVDPALAQSPEPINALLTGLQQIKNQSLDRGLAIQPLIEIWTQVSDRRLPDWERPERDMTFHWKRISTMPEARLFFTLRERAAAAALDREGVPAAKDVPLSTRIQDAIHAAIAREDWDFAARLLDLDAAYAGMLLSTHNACEEAVRTLKRADAAAHAGHSAEAARWWSTVIADSDLPSASEVAARRLKALHEAKAATPKPAQ